MLTAVIPAAMSGCAAKTDRIRADEVSMTTSPASSYLYLVQQADIVEQLIDVYEGLEYRPSNEEIDYLGDLMSVIYHYKGEATAQFWTTPDGLLILGGDPDRVYRITSDFDYEAIRELFVNYSVDF